MQRKVAPFKDLAKEPEGLVSGHRLCAGCPHSMIVRQVLHGAHPYTPVIVAATGCLEVATTPIPFTSWAFPMAHCAFENAAAVISGVIEGYESQKERGELPPDHPELRFVAFAGDGGTYDIGFQSLSGALERGHRFMYVCLNNEGYMNTGIQRSSATSMGAWTTTTWKGKVEWRKDLTGIVERHNIPYIAQTTLFTGKPRDLVGKAAKGFDADGPAFLNVLAPCGRGWRFETDETTMLADLAVETCYWPLFEVDHGKWKLSYAPKQKLPIVEFLKAQGRFKHILVEMELVDTIQKKVDEEWEALLKRCKA